MMRAQVPDWVSIKSDKFPEYISNLEGGMTTKALILLIVCRLSIGRTRECRM